MQFTTMSDDYDKAHKLATRAYKNAIADGRSPYLPVLDNILEYADIEYETNLGIMEISVDRIVGTCTAGRTQAFANNFMPLLDTGSEFSRKWNALVIAQIEEGIHDAIKVYEYMNLYYVLEGNKRVSVMKYLNNPFIIAEVIREVPRHTSDPDIERYYKYMEFHAATGIPDVLMKNAEQYQLLMNLIGVSTEHRWQREQRLDFRSLMTDFTKSFERLGGTELPGDITESDALVYYLSIFPYEESIHASGMEIDKNLESIWSDITLLGTKEQVSLEMHPMYEGMDLTLTMKNLFSLTRKKVAFVYDKAPEDSDWTYSHELGRLHLESEFSDVLKTHAFVVPDAGEEAETLLERICEDHFDIVFTVTPRLIRSTVKAAAAYPDVIFLNCSPRSAHKTLRTYYTRLYEVKFLTGMIAGALCENDKIGYIADYPIYGAAANINAFALGARAVNPRAKVYLAWSCVKDTNPDDLFWNEQVNYISAQDMIAPRDASKNFGLYTIHDGVKTNLAMSFSDWGNFYERLIKNILRGNWKRSEATDAQAKAVNYWWGLSAGVIDVICSQNLPIYLVKLMEQVQNAIAGGTFNLFTGPLTDQNGVVHLESTEEALSPSEILTMDYLLDNVIGTIPTLDELEESAREMVRLRGLNVTVQAEGGNSVL